MLSKKCRHSSSSSSDDYPPTPTPSCCVMTAFQVYVDFKYGNDATGALESPARPFRTIEAAIGAVVLARGTNVTEGWIVHISPGTFPALVLENLDALILEGSGEYTVLAGLTLLNTGLLSPVIVRNIKLAETVTPTPGLLQQFTPLVNVDSSTLQMFNSFVDDGGNATTPVFSFNNAGFFMSSSNVNATISEGIPVFDIGGGGLSFVDLNKNNITTTTAQTEPPAEPLSIIRNSSTALDTVVSSLGNNLSTSLLGANVVFFSSAVDSEGLMIGSNDTVQFVENEETLRRRNLLNARRQTNFIKAKNLQQIDGEYAVAQQRGNAKIVVSNNRVAGEVTINNSTTTTEGKLLLQNTAYGDNPVPITQLSAVVDNGTDRGGSLWYSGAFSIGTILVGTVEVPSPYTISPKGNDYAVYIGIDNAIINLPPLTSRKGRIIEIILTLKADGNLAQNATVNAAPGDLIYDLLQAPAPFVILGDIGPPPTFSLNKLRLQSTKTATGNIWFNMF